MDTHTPSETGSAPPGALSGILVLDLGHVLAAPYATQLLADLGADVIKVEHPQRGDFGRGFGRRLKTGGEQVGEAGMFASANRNKRGITIDFSRPGGRRIARQLAARCDVVVENYPAGTIAKYGLGYDELSRINPGLVYCSLTGFGQTGQNRRRPGYDPVFQAMSGLMSVTGPETGLPGSGPLKTGPSLIDVATGFSAALGIVTALFHRQRSGRGQNIDVALLDVAVALQSHLVQDYLLTGEQPPRLGNTGNGSHPATVFECADGHIYISAGQSNYGALCDLLGRPDLKTDPRFIDNASRFANRVAWTDSVRETFMAWRKRDLETALIAIGVPASAVNSYGDLFDGPHAQERGLEIRMDSRAVPGTPLRLVANPLRMSETMPSYRLAPPRLGEHTEEVLSEYLGLTGAEIAALRESGDI